MDQIGPIEIISVAVIAIFVATFVNAVFIGPSCRDHKPSPATPVTFTGIVPSEWTEGEPREQDFSVKVARCTVCGELQFFCMTIPPERTFMVPVLEDIAFAAAPIDVKRELWRQYRHQKRIARKRDISAS